MKNALLSTVATAVIAAAIVASGPVFADQHNGGHTATPIKHLVVIFNENVSFDHYFATYPNATNPAAEPRFHAKGNTPNVNNLVSASLLTNNPNYTNTANGSGAAEPFRLDRTQAATADQNHAYTAEQQAYDGGKADLFPEYTGSGTSGGVGAFGTTGQVMGYFDGNTVTAIWNYAQNFAMSDAAYTDTYGPSTPGALEVVSGQTNGMKIVATTHGPFTLSSYSYYINDGQGGYTMINDVDPAYDVCSSSTNQVLMNGKNVGNLLDAAHITWGSFMGGFHLHPTSTDKTGCQRSTYSHVVKSNVVDYIPHHAWFQYFPSTANPTHARPSSIAVIGHTMEADGKTLDPANHNYGLKDFYAAVKAGNFPAVSYIKMPAYEDAHAGYSDPLDEQQGTVKLVNFLQKQPEWKNTAVIITYDDSDGWYDHAYVTPTSASFDTQADQLNGSGKCGTGATQPNGLDGKPVNGRCGPGTRIPFLVISPYAKRNYVSHTQISLASVVRFIEDNWLHGERLGGGSFDAATGSIMDMFDFDHRGQARRLFLNPVTGTVAASAAVHGDRT